MSTVISKAGAERARVPFSLADQHTRAIMKLAREQATSWEPVGADGVGLPVTQGEVPMLDVIPSIVEVPSVSEDAEAVQLPEKIAGFFAEKITGAALDRLPVVDDTTPWESSAAVEDCIEAFFGGVLPAPTDSWEDTTSDRAIERLTMQGLAAHRLEPVTDPVDDAAFVVDLSWMVGFEVRSGFLPFGASAYFSADGSVLRIYVSHDDRTYAPGDDGWEQAKWVWKSSVLTVVSVVDHLGSTHFLTSNVVTTVAREALPPNHPVRRLVKAFTYGAADVNRAAALTLSNRGGIAHRLWSFTYEGLARLLLRGYESAGFESFPVRMAGMESLGERYPFRSDGLALHEIFTTYLRDYLGVYYSGEELVRDDGARAFWQALQRRAPGLGLRPLTSSTQFEETLAEFMFAVTGMHAQVGSVVEYLVDPTFMTTKLVPGQRESDAQSTVQALNLASLTGLEQPPLIGDYRHLLLDDDARAVFDRYQASLVALSERIESRNATLDQPFRKLDPVLLDTSVST